MMNSPSIIIKNCLSESQARGQFFSDFVGDLFSENELNDLYQSEKNDFVVLMLTRIGNFYSLTEEYGEDAAYHLLKNLKKSTRRCFELFFPESPLIVHHRRMEENIICFRMHEKDIANLGYMAMAFRLKIKNYFRNKIKGVIRQPVEIFAGFSWIDGFHEDGFYKTLFKAFCDARRLSSQKISAGSGEWSPSLFPFSLEKTLESEVKISCQHENESLDGPLKCSTPIHQIVRPALTAAPDTLVQHVKRILEDQAPMTSVVVTDQGKPLGIVMNYSLDRKLGTQYGVALYYRKEVVRVMDRHPLIVDACTPVEEVARSAMSRGQNEIYHDIIVTEEGRFSGIVSVRKMLDYLAEVNVTIAMGANPLTGLPGNLAIEQEIRHREKKHLPSSLLYVDLDHFKVYNDVYGFERGDQVLLFTADVIRKSVKMKKEEDIFVGHVGGDDFVVISPKISAEDISENIIRRFEKGIPEYYSPEDRKIGFIRGEGRDGVVRDYPMISVSIGIVNCDFEVSVSVDELSHRIAEIKKYAKSLEGNAYAKDRRTPLGSKKKEQ